MREGFFRDKLVMPCPRKPSDDGTPVPIEQPTEIKTPPLSENDQDDRVRLVFGLTHDDPLPSVSFETLVTYAKKSSSRSK
jgi:hypothetical protein